MVEEIKHPYIYLYDMPVHIATSVKIAEILKKACDYDLTDPAQFKTPRISSSNGLLSPLVSGIIKVDRKDFQKVAEAIKYFDIVDTSDDQKVWHCRALPYEKHQIGLVEENIFNLKEKVFLMCIPKHWSAKDLEQKFSSFGPIKSAKIYLSAVVSKDVVNEKAQYFVRQDMPCESTGSGFILFEKEEDATRFNDCE